MAFGRVLNRRGNSKDQRTDTGKKIVGTQAETNNAEKKKKKFSLLCILFFSLVSFGCIIWIFYPRLTFYTSKSPPSDHEVHPVQDSDLSTEVFHSLETFRRDYMDMESNFKIFMYPFTDNDIVCDIQRRLHGKHASEGYFFQNLDQSQFLTMDPEKAHLFFIPVYCHKLHAERRSSDEMAMAVQDFVNSLISKYPYWNRTLGADHFFVICHDISANATQRVLHLVKNSIRVVCSPSYDVQYVPHKDISLPQILQPYTVPPAGNDVKNRTSLTFWAGRRSSHIRDVLIQFWQNDTELDIQNNRMKLWRGRVGYQEKFYRSKFCICPGGHHVHCTRIADAIRFGCVPVILSDYYILPFNEILDWRKFSVLLKENDVYQLKKILKDIPEEKYRFLQYNTVRVQKHFQWNSPPISFDAFHMVITYGCAGMLSDTDQVYCSISLLQHQAER